MSDLVAVADAIRRILADVTPLAPESVSLAEARGRTLAAPLVALRTQPPFLASAMDGYAVRAADAAQAGARLTVIGMAAAGHGFAGKVAAGEAVRIFTGAPIPEGADAVLIQEDAVAVDANTIAAKEVVAAGQNVRRAGLDFAKGAELIAGGEKLEARGLALAAAMGHARLEVRRRPRVGIIATGDELVPAGTMPGPGQIVASSRHGIAALVEAAGGAAEDLGIVADDGEKIEAAIERARALPVDILVTLGGASVGDHDLVGAALAARGMALDFWRIAMRPGKPLMFGRLGPMRVLGLPGNPVSSHVCALLFLRPLIGGLLGIPYTDPSEPALIGADLAANDRREDYLRATLAEGPDGLPVATAFPVQDSSMLSVLAAADCLLIRPPLAPPARVGERCRIIRLRAD